jgi:16S rRNA (guanine966-N2)-methyltransferase
MRIVGGNHRGRRLSAPPGATVRPTGDRVREALFDILLHGRFAGAGNPLAIDAVLDAFAGTGALGLEALSRGAPEAVFIEHDGGALAALRRNVEMLGETDHALIIPGDATRPPRGQKACRIAFLDPPYGSGLATPAVTALAAAGWIASDALAVIEVGARERLAPPAGFVCLDERVYGAARLVFLGRGIMIGGLP